MIRSVIFLLLMLSLEANGYARQTRYIDLKNEKAAYKTNHYFVRSVADAREPKAADGWMNEDELAMRNGAAASVRAFVQNNVRQNPSGQPIDLRITKLYAEITRKGSQWQINVEMGIGFFAGETQLITYSGSGNAHASADPVGYLGTVIKKALVDDLKQFDAWWAANKGEVPISEEVNVSVTVSATPDNPGDLVYALGRPLQEADFKGPKGNNPAEAAATVSGIGLRYHTEVENSRITIKAIVFANFITGESWFKNTEQNQRVLAHEQTHFDITALYACRLADKIRTTKFTRENYQRLLLELQQQHETAEEDEERQYDAETNHGTIHEQQEAWQRKIRQEVERCGCY